MLRGQPDPHSSIADPFAVRNDPIALMRTGPLEPPRHMPGAGVGRGLELESQGWTDGRSQALVARLPKHKSHFPFLPLVVARAGAVAPTTTSARGATRVGHPIASSIHPRSDTPSRELACPRFRFPSFLASQPLEDGTNCAAVGVIFLWEWVMIPCPRWAPLCQRSG